LPDGARGPKATSGQIDDVEIDRCEVGTEIGAADATAAAQVL
jgi:hypothetical protein